MRFEQLGNLHWAWLLVPVACILLAGLFSTRRRLRAFASSELLSGLTSRISFGRIYVRACLFLLALIALIGAMIDPRWGTTFEDVKQRGIDLVVVVDVSRSMLAEDASPNRLERARQFAFDLTENLGGDRIGLVAGAGTASLRCPLTIDYGAFRLALRELAPESTTRGGSLLGDAIRVAAESFTDELPDSKAIIVFSDGEDQGSYPIEAARAAFEEKGIRVFTVALGDAVDGARIPLDPEDPTDPDAGREWQMYNGSAVITKADDELLDEVARVGGGAFIPVGVRTMDLQAVFEQKIEPVTRREFDTRRLRRHHPRYQWFALLALACLVAESLLGTRRTATKETDRT